MTLASFEGTFSDDDWVHALGGVHVLCVEDGSLVGHAAVVERQLGQGGRTFRAGYLEAMGVLPDRRRRGYGSMLLARAEELVRRDFELGALSASALGATLYERRGWHRWRGTTWARTAAERVRTEADDDAIFVYVVDEAPDLAGELVCDWREGDLW